jgi:hypothetical protein
MECAWTLLLPNGQGDELHEARAQPERNEEAELVVPGQVDDGPTRTLLPEPGPVRIGEDGLLDQVQGELETSGQRLTLRLVVAGPTPLRWRRVPGRSVPW